MKKKLLFIIPAAVIVGITLLSNTDKKIEKYHKDGVDIVNFSSNPNLGLTGAPGEANCTQCHSGTTQSATATSGMTTSLTNYQIGQTYTFAMGSTVNTVNGFEMTILDNSGNQAGSFVAGATNTSISASGGKEYIRHSTKTQSWSFDWTAPATDIGALTAYYAMAETDNSGSTSGDVIYLGSMSIASDASNGLTNYQIQDQKINMFFNESNQELNVKYKLNEKSKISVQIVDLTGKVIENVDLGSKSFGPHSEKIQLENIHAEGIYVVTLFINNGVFNRKIYLK